jgi:EAL domain-containing protein (putative c-di-GMP-specific phosphodiesterase class I)
VETVALDRTLVSQVGHTVRAEAVVRAVTSAAHELGFSVAAKGIEREAQEQRLRALGCSFGQGHLYGQPVPEELAIDRLKTGLPLVAELAEAS